MECLGISNGANHGIKRAIYLFPFASNLKDVIGKGRAPKRIKRNIADVTDFWKQRWAVPRAEKNKEYLDYSGDRFIEDTIKEVKKYKKLYKQLQ